MPFEPETGLFTGVALTQSSGAANHEAAVVVGLPTVKSRVPILGAYCRLTRQGG